MSVLHGATNTTITNGNFTAVSTTVVNIGPQNDIVALLHSHSAIAGLLDAGDRFDTPKCDEGTRTSMIFGMKKFVQDGDSASSSALYWLHGPAGAGKSALAQSLSLLLDSESDHAASFFFSRTSPGRNNGNQLIVTLAYQLAINLPPLQRYISKTVKKNPAILTASNATQMQRLIIDPINQWRKSYRWSVRRRAYKILNTHKRLHPRLILVDGLDECQDPAVQRDLILCIGLAIRQLSLPFRFVIASRPESHIVSTFALERPFQGLDAVQVFRYNLGDDEDADEQITTYLLNQFAEIRRVHPIREYLPQPWPLPSQIAELVTKSSKGFIYPVTVIRYIKMPNSRPDECLERILGLSEIPLQDKPYEPLDTLYRHIFCSVPDVIKEDVRNIFHFLVVTNTLANRITPRLIEKCFDHKPGHVHHVLRDLSCIVTVTTPDHPIEILHASLPDFLLDPSRSGPLCINTADAHSVITEGAYKLFGPATCLRRSTFARFTYHLMHSKITERLLNVLVQLEPVHEYARLCEEMLDRHGASAIHSSYGSMTSLVEYLLILVIKDVPTMHIVRHIEGIEMYIVRKYPLGVDLHLVQDEVPVHAIIPSLRKCKASWGPGVGDFYERCCSAQHSSRLVERISKLYMLMMVPFYELSSGHSLATNSGVIHAKSAMPSLRYPRLALSLMVFLTEAKSGTGTGGLFLFTVNLIPVFIGRSGYSEPLTRFLETYFLRQRPTGTSDSGSPSFKFTSLPTAKHFRTLVPSVSQYFERVRLESSAPTIYNCNGPPYRGPLTPLGFARFARAS